MFPSSLTHGDAFVFNCDGEYLGRIPAKCCMCRPEPCKLDRVFVVVSDNELNIAERNMKMGIK